MGFVESLLRVLLSLVCGAGQRPQQQEPPSYPQPAPGKPTYAQEAAYPAPPQQAYPPPQKPPAWQQQPQPQPQAWQQQPQQQPSYAHPAAGHPKPQHKPHHGSPSPPGGRVDPNQVNQSNPHYTGLRDRARQEGDAMARAYDESHRAYQAGDGARANELSNEGHAHKAEMERLNREASEWIFRENNTDSQPGEIDLHGLYVKEAIEYTDRAIQDARYRGDAEIHLIVGKGLHSTNGQAKIKPAIEELMQKHNLVAALDPNNAGVLIVRLGGGDEKVRDRGMPVLGADDITRRLGEKGEGCIIM